ncbi:multidrug ABC transporter ATPase [Agromyces sp. NPDC058110]|uniref:multidrug ABC transporter ATPase n=1 Tax=Agromyces sp. NPDC058110 TaxID=3346345 RepID=UPI0036DB517F
MSETQQSGSQRVERVLAFMFAGLVLLSIAAFIAVIFATVAGVAENDGFSQGVWPVVIMLPWFGLPIAFLLLIALFIVHAVNRSRTTRAQTN